MSTLRNISFEEAHVALEECDRLPGNRISRIPGVPAAGLAHLSEDLSHEEWVTFKAAYDNIERSTDRYWLPAGLAVHTAITIAPGVMVDVSYLYLFSPPEDVLDQLAGLDT